MKQSFFTKLKAGLSKTRNNMVDKLNSLFKAGGRIDEDFYEEMEELLISSDVGVDTTLNIVEELRKRVKAEKINDVTEVKTILKSELADILKRDVEPLRLKKPTVILVVGVNGAGKTTTIGKLAARYKDDEGLSVLIAAGDTFRAAAAAQLTIWGERAGVRVIKHQEGADPGAVIYDAIHAAKSRGTDLLICDTAGRLHNKKNLMNELGKISRIIEREYPEAAKEVFLVLDATTGQNAIIQAKTFAEVAGVTGVVLTKLDGTARGGVVLAVKNELSIPIRFICIGEGIDDMQEFEPDGFVDALFDEE